MDQSEDTQSDRGFLLNFSLFDLDKNHTDGPARISCFGQLVEYLREGEKKFVVGQA